MKYYYLISIIVKTVQYRNQEMQTEAYVLDKNIQLRLKHVKVNNYCVSM